MRTNNLRQSTFFASVDYWPQQSPIEIHHCETFYVKSIADDFCHSYPQQPVPGQFKFADGHWNFVLNDKFARPTIRFGAITATLAKIHVHTKSEHDLEGENHAGEIHFVHEIDAPTKGSTLLALGVFFDEAANEGEGSLDLHEWTEKFIAAREKQQLQDDESIHLRGLLPDDLSQWYHYEGSLTSPPSYSENVSWIVFKKPLSCPTADLDKLKQFACQPERLPQPLNRRFILRSFK